MGGLLAGQLGPFLAGVGALAGGAVGAAGEALEVAAGLGLKKEKRFFCPAAGLGADLAIVADCCCWFFC